MVEIVDLADRCPRCGFLWSDHPELDELGRDDDGRRIGDPFEPYCRQLEPSARGVVLKRRSP